MGTSSRQKIQAGFTIVELLIVIVVIGILAAISLVAYNGITNKANIASAQSAAAQANKKVLLSTGLNNDQVPTDLAAAGVVNSGNTTYQYAANTNATPQTFCITATKGTASYYINNTDHPTPTSGGCPGHGQGGIAAITNLIPNPSIETDTSNLQNIGSAGGRITGRVQPGSPAYSGSYVFRATQPTAGTGMGGYGSVTVDSIPVGQYTASLWVRSNQAVNARLYMEGTAAKSPGSSSAIVLTPNTWSRLQLTFSVTAAGTVKVGYLSESTAPVANTYVEFDGVMLTQGPTLYNYADGDSSNWAWNGTQGLSTSSGPPSQ